MGNLPTDLTELEAWYTGSGKHKHHFRVPVDYKIHVTDTGTSYSAEICLGSATVAVKDNLTADALYHLMDNLPEVLSHSAPARSNNEHEFDESDGPNPFMEHVNEALRIYSLISSR